MQMEIRSTSPDGMYILRTFPWEARMSLWVEPPELIDASSQEVLLRFASDHWSLDRAEWRSPTLVSLQLRKYPGGHAPSHLEVVVDCQARTATLGTIAGIPLEALERALDDCLAWGAA
jgi:hypothetical protein